MKNALISLFCLMLILAASAGSARANTAANTAIVNTAKLTYNGGLTATSSVTVTVALVPSTPNVNITSATSAYTAPGTPSVTDTVTITSTANGPASYTVTPSVTASTNTLGAPALQPAVTGGATVTIGATVTTGTGTSTYITVPASGASGASPAAINGIAVNDIIVFTVGGTTYAPSVSSFTDNGDGTYRMNFASIGSGVTIPSGTQVGERTQVNLTATPGTISVQGTDITTTVRAVVSTPAAPFGGAPAPADASATTTPPNRWTSTSPSIFFQKYSRNVFNSAGNASATGSTSININSTTNNYFTGNVTGQPGDTIEYVIKATNNGTLDINNCAISDQVPVAYVSNLTAPYGGANVFYIAPDNTTSQLVAGAVGAGLASFVPGNSPNLIVNVGTGATGAAGGIVPATRSVTIAYQVTIK